MPTSQSASVKASRMRAAYGAPEAPVMPRKTRTRAPWLFRALRRVQEDRDRMDLGGTDLQPELRHPVVAELARVGDVRGQPVAPAALRPFVAQVGSAEVGRAGAEV